jgi:RHS repeat-associated protein
VPIGDEFVQQTAYDALNRPVKLTQPDQTELHYAYDKGGLLNFVQRNDTEIPISDITYNEKQQRLNIYYGNNTVTKYEYNLLNFRLTRILTTRNTGQEILQDLNYSYDAVGNITQQTDNAQQTNYFNNTVVAPTGTYTYDALYRLISATGRELNSLVMPSHEDFPNGIPCPNPVANAMQNYTQHYQYDELGNILQMSSQGNWTRNYIYDTATNRLLRHSGTANEYTYDAHGNILSMPHLSLMAWDKKDQLHRASNGTFTSYYNYDTQGNRTRKVVVKGNIIETRYYIDGYEVYRKENSTADFERITLNISDDEKTFVRIETKTGENEVIRYQYDNHLGSACLELDNIGQIISYEEYHPFGTTSYRSGRNETEVSLKRYKYCGKERDEQTGFYYYGMRYYAGWLCRFVSVDPMADEYLNLTPYAYCNNNPLKYIDPTGMFYIDPPWKNISPVIPKNKFVKYDRSQCFDLAKRQLNVVGYTTKAGYYGTDETTGKSTTYQVYTEQKGVNKSETVKAIEYLNKALEAGMPVLAGVDNATGDPGNHDKTTDHYIVIVGKGNDEKGNYYSFYDNATANIVTGTNSENKLYYDSETGKITGRSQTNYAQEGERNYTITHIRETKTN